MIIVGTVLLCFFFSSRRRHTRSDRDWSSDVCSSDLISRLRRALVSGEFFDVLGARPVLGRALQPSDDVYGAAPVMVLSYGAWQRRFGGDTHVLGRQIVMYEDGVPYTIVGVMPQGLDYPRGSDFWAPVAAAIPPKGLPFVSLHVVG